MKRISDIFIAAVILLIVLLIILPMPTFLMDVLLITNISISILIMLVTLYAKSAMQFSTFPSVLLIVTLFRLALNISSTRLILGNGGDAGHVIETFGGFVIGDNLVVGLVLFLIIIIIQFIVITKGSERVAEVGARFTLDAMPGKQMAIDADLNAGIIDDATARKRRQDIQREADFYGAMDGASKFVKGDAIVAIIVIVVNIVGGIIIGTMTGGMAFGDVANIYVRATVGDGLVCQIPALLISTSTGMIVTRAETEHSIGSDITGQLFAQPLVLMVLAGMLTLFSLIPGLPMLPILALAVLFGTLGFLQMRAQSRADEEVPEDVTQALAEEKRKPENVMALLQVDPIELEFGYGLLPLVDTSQGGDLLYRVVMIRRQCAVDLGIVVPVIRLRDNIQLGTNRYVIKIKGVEVSGGEVIADHVMALNAGNATGELKGIETIEPAFGLPAVWISEADRERAEAMGYSTIDPPSVIATHLTEIIKRYGHELLGRQQVQALLDNLKSTQAALVDEVVPKMFTLGEVQKVLGNLLKEGISIRDMVTILETLSDYGRLTHDPEMLTEYVRQNLKRSITRQFAADKKLRVVSLDAGLEQLILDNVRQSDHGSYVALEPEHIRKMFASLKHAIEHMTDMGRVPVVLTSPMVRRHFKHVTEQMAPDLTVLSFNELEPGVEITSDGVVAV
jgi:flagellar biosynthesis protein FlhA